MQKIKISDVFRPGSMPSYTYIHRLATANGVTYESKLKKALARTGNLVLIIGGTKTGKTVLCNKVVPHEKIVRLSGSHIRTDEDFWKYTAEALEIPDEIQEDELLQGMEEEGERYSGRAGILSLLATVIGIEKRRSITQGSGKTKKILRSNSLLTKILIQGDYVLVIDDFHYIPKEVQLYLARVLKTELFHGLKVVLLSLPHRADEAVKLNPDLIGRTSFIEIAPWTKAELKEIAKKGFDCLRINADDQLLDFIADESALSPLLMQENCFNLSFRLKEKKTTTITRKDIEDAFTDTVEDNRSYQDIVQFILDGPKKGRARRKQYKTQSGELCEIYGLLLRSISTDPPVLSLKIRDIENRMKNILAPNEKAFTSMSLGKIIKHAEEIANESIKEKESLEWKDSVLYILDPFLLFYLRWDKSWKN